MITILFVSTKADTLSGLALGLKHYDEVETIRASSCRKALDLISGKPLDLVVVDENIAGVTGLQCAQKMVFVNPVTNYAVISSLSPKDFHEASEGLGVLMQLPVRPDEKQAEILIDRLKKILNLTHRPGKL